MKVTLNDEQWKIVAKELPRGSDLRNRVEDLRDDAMTFGEAEGEFDDAGMMWLGNLGLPWLDTILEQRAKEHQS